MTDPARRPRPIITPERYEGTLAGMVQSALHALSAGGLPLPEARALACDVIDRIATDFGGGNVYLPRNDALKRTLRNLSIWHEYDGTPHGPHGISVLAKQHRLTEIAIYRIIEAQRQAHRSQTQPDLPGLTAVNSPSPAREAV
jgi:Mor family transcriptional regulator